MSLELLTRAVERILSARYGNTVTVRITNVGSKSEEDGSPGRSEADKGL